MSALPALPVAPILPTAPALLTLQAVNEGVCQVLDANGLHLGNLKLIGGRWKFKAVGYAPGGEVEPGGGPLTDRHNTVFDRLDAHTVAQELGLSGGQPA